MIILTVLLVALLAIVAVSIVTLLLSGVGLVAVFGDLIVFGFIVYGLIKLFKKRKVSP